MPKDAYTGHESSYNYSSTPSGQGNWNTGGDYTGTGNFTNGIAGILPRYSVAGGGGAPRSPLINAILGSQPPANPVITPTAAPPPVALPPGVVDPVRPFIQPQHPHSTNIPAIQPHQFFNYQPYHEPVMIPTSMNPNGPSFGRGGPLGGSLMNWRGTAGSTGGGMGGGSGGGW